MGTRFGKYVEDSREEHPHLKDYARCQSRAFVMAMTSFLMSGAVMFIGQAQLQKFMPHNPSLMVAFPMAGGGIVGYIVARQQTKRCQNMWLALEDKHSYIKELGSEGS